MRELCPKRMLNGPCGGIRGELCEVDDFQCPFYKAFENLRSANYLKPLLDKGFKVECEPGDVELSGYAKMLEEGGPVLSTEVEPWSLKDVQFFETLKDKYHAFNVTDNPFGKPHVSSVAVSIELKRRGMEVIAQLTTRSRTREALASDLMSLNAFGVTNVLALTGDWAPHSVFDLDAVRLVCLISLMNKGLLWDGSEIEPTTLVPGVASNPYFKYEKERLLRKARAGAVFAQTQPIFTSEIVRSLKEYPVTTVPSLLISTSRKVVRSLKEKGVKVPKEYEEGLIKSKAEGKADEFVLEYNLKLAEEILSKELKGIHVMAPGRWDLLVKFGNALRELL